MRHAIHLSGLLYSLRPVKSTDASAIILLRSSKDPRNKFIHSTSASVEDQNAWLENYFERDSDYYFVVYNNLTGETEGLIGIYDVEKGSGEWGRWVLRPGSLAATESMDLMYKVAFNILNLSSVYSRTLSDNVSVVRLHDAIVGKRACVHRHYTSLNGVTYDAIEHEVSALDYYARIQPELESRSARLFQRSIGGMFGGFRLHHVGVACRSIESDFNTWRILGYEREGIPFEDRIQGVRGLFITHPHCPRLELLENLPSSGTLTRFIESSTKIYHFGFFVDSIASALQALTNFNARLLSPTRLSEYFQTKICFLVLQNRFIIELIESA
jgi:RimJ/RimL family protein N-acetyltransferase